MFIKNKWYIILSSEELKRNKLIKIRRFGTDIILWRDSNNSVHAAESKCPHRGADLGLGKIVDDCVQCPYHGFLFDGDGDAVLIPSMGKSSAINPNYRVKSYKVKEYMNFIFLWYGDGSASDEINWLEGIDKTFSSSTYRATWKVNYTRAIENQLDVAHLPFVHKTTIGRDNKTVVNGPIAELNGDILNVWVYNETDTGQKPRKSDEIKKEECIGRLQFIFPNYWQNIINDRLRIMAAFVPEDDETTIIYLRIYQKFVNFPIVSTIINSLMMQFNKIVLNQDKNVVESQIPKRGDIYSKELLVKADEPIILFRKYIYKNAETNKN